MLSYDIMATMEVHNKAVVVGTFSTKEVDN